MTLDNINDKPKGVLGFLLPSTSAWKYWLFMGLLFKGVLFFLQIHDHTVDSIYQIPGFIGGTWGDTKSYLDPVENMLAGKGYDPDYRQPGFAVFYLPLLYLFTKATACNIIIFLQAILSAISVYALALSAKNIFKNDGIFYITFYLYAISNFANCFDNILMTESLSTSFLIFSVYYFSRYMASLKAKDVILSGLFLTWVIFLKPVFSPLLALYFLLLSIQSKKLKIAFYVLLAFIMVDGTWMVRNYMKYKQVVPFSRALHYFGVNSYYPSVLTFCGAWGGYRSATQTWLLPELSPGDFKPDAPDDIYTSKFNFDSLKNIRALIRKVTVDSAGIPAKQQSAYTEEIKQKLLLYTQSIKQEKPMLYYGKANFISLDLLLSIDYCSIVFLNKYTIALSKWIYYFTLIAGGIGLLLLLFKMTFKNTVALIFAGIPGYTIIAYALILRIGENRYFVPSYPFVVVCAAYALYCLYTNFIAKDKKKSV